VTDQWGAKDTCYLQILVIDATPPDVQCPADMYVGTDPDQCGAIVTYEVTTTDNCPAATVACTPPSGSFFPKGQTKVRAIATDHAGMADTCEFYVTVTDDDPPVAKCPGDTTIIIPEGANSAVVTYTSSATDNCPGVSLTCTPASGSVFPLGVTNGRCIATDASGNADTCFFVVAVARTACFDRLADLNCDGIVNVQDVVTAVNVAFRGTQESDLPPCTSPPRRH